MSTEVNITKYPRTIQPLKDGEQLTIGDLHANALKFIYMLVQKGVMTISKDNFKKLVEAYQLSDNIGRVVALRRRGKPLKIEDEFFEEESEVLSKFSGWLNPGSAVLTEELTKREKDLINDCTKKFNEALASATFSKCENLIREIGDDKADRSGCDYFVLQVSKALKNANIPEEILASNHGNEFLQAFENNFKNFQSPSMHVFGQDASMVNLGLFVEAGVIKKDELINLVKTYYLPKLKLLSYSIDEKNQKITLYTHAPVGLETVKALAKKFKVTYSDETIVDLARTIEEINDGFSYLVNKKEVNKFSDINEAMYKYKCDLAKASTEYPLVRVMWHRGYEGCDLSDTKNGYNLHYVHGHDEGSKVFEKYIGRVTNCDNDLGKGPGAEVGDYDNAQVVTYGRSLSELNKFVTDVKGMIETQDWQLGSFGGGRNIQVGKVSKKVPTHVAKIYEVIVDSKLDETNLEKVAKVANQVESIASSARFFRNPFRQPATQDFYSACSKGFTPKR